MPIFSSAPTKSRLGAASTPVPCAPTKPRTVTNDDELLSILESPAQCGETIEMAFKRRERDLGAAFARLAPVDAIALHRRLVSPIATDRFATRFSQLVVERRIRLLTFLADARRRRAIAVGKEVSRGR